MYGMQGRVKKDKLDSFNLPFYAPSMDEVRDVITRSQAFDITHIRLFESNWDPHDDDDVEMKMEEDVAAVQSGVNVARSIRAVIGPLIARHFGEHILDDLFELHAKNVAVHLQKVKTKYPVIVVSLQAK
jgi:anthranilate O-methyltransferase